MSASSPLQLFPSPPLNQLSVLNIQKITDNALHSVQARKGSSVQGGATPKTPELTTTELVQTPQSSNVSKSSIKTSRVLISPMDFNYITSPVRKTSDTIQQSPYSARSSPQRSQHLRKQSRVESLRSASSTYVENEFHGLSNSPSPATRTNSPAFSQRSAPTDSPTSVVSRSGSRATFRTHNTSPRSSTESGAQIRSNFQAYHRNLPIADQTYHPVETIEAGEFRSRSSPRAQIPQGDSYSTPGDMHTLWEISNGQRVEKCAKSFRLQVYHRNPVEMPKQAKTNPKPLANTTIFSFGTSADLPFFSVYTSTNALDVKPHIEVRRHSPSNNAYSIPVADFSLPKVKASPTSSFDGSESRKDEITASFTPKLATLLALDSVDKLKRANASGSTVYDNAVAASKLLTQAIESAERKHSSIILYESMTNEYFLCQPSIGILPLQVSGVVRLPLQHGIEMDTEGRPNDETASQPSVQANPTKVELNPIKMHPVNGQVFSSHNIGSGSDSMPSRGSGSISLWTSPGTAATKRHLLASLDFFTSTLTLHSAALATLDDLFLIDTIVCTLTAVALAESRRACARASAEMHQLIDNTSKSRDLPRGKWSVEIRNRDGEMIGDEETGDLPKVTRGIVKGVQAAAHIATVLVGVAAKLTTDTVVRASRAVSKT